MLGRKSPLLTFSLQFKKLTYWWSINSAVVRGAIIRGLQGDIAAVQSRLSRRYYGVVHDSKFDETKHDESEKKWHDLRCEWVVRNRIQWYIRRVCSYLPPPLSGQDIQD